MKRKSDNRSSLCTHKYSWVTAPSDLPTPWSWEDAEAEGFKAKNTNWEWSADDEKQLKKTLKMLHSKEDRIHTQDPYEWISHYGFDRRISKKCISAKIDKMNN